MPQNPLAAVVAQNPSKALVPLQVDANGNLITTAASGGNAVTVADGADITQGAKADAAWSGSGAGSVIAVLKKLVASLAATISVSAVGRKYYTVAASQTAQALGTGAIGDVLSSITYIPATTAAGVVTAIDGTGGGAVTVSLFVGGGTTALTNLAPVTVALNLTSTVGGWHVTTGANISAIATGTFTP